MFQTTPLSPWRTMNRIARVVARRSFVRPRATRLRSRRICLWGRLQWAFQLPAARTLATRFLIATPCSVRVS